MKIKKLEQVLQRKTDEEQAGGKPVEMEVEEEDNRKMVVARKEGSQWRANGIGTAHSHTVAG